MPDRGFLVLALLGKTAQGFERFGADVVLDSLRIPPSRLCAHSKRKQEGFDNAVPFPGVRPKALSHLGKNHTFIRLLRNQPLVREAFQHFRNCRLGNPEPFRNIDLSCMSMSRDQVADKLDVILHKFQPPRMARLAKTRRLNVWREKRIRFAFFLYSHRPSFRLLPHPSRLLP